MILEYVEGGVEMLESFRGMWERLNAHHARISPDFSWLYAGRDFAWRMDKWLRQGAGGLWACLANAGGEPAGFCVCSVDASGLGELATLYVDEAHRRQGIGKGLARRGLAWLAGQEISGISVEVVSGNEAAVALYRSLGFKPRTLRLSILPEPSGGNRG